MISYDEACKQVLANKMILAWILKACVREYSDCDIKEIADKYIEGSRRFPSRPYMWMKRQNLLPE